MKNNLLTLLFVCMASLGFSQVIFYAEEPANVEGNYGMTYAEAGGTWNVPDLTIPSNYVYDTLAFIEDSLACPTPPTTNGPALDGNIAVLYRGDCEFGTKALEAQNNGAIAVVIINNVPGAPVGMAGGADGGSVTIPVVMISQQDGATLRAEYDNGSDIAVFIGNKVGYYDDDLGLTADRFFRAKHGHRPALVTTDNNDYSHKVGGYVVNFGLNDQNSINLHCKIINNGNVVYDESGTPTSTPLISGDSVEFVLPDFSMSSYPTGNYEFVYHVTSSSTDEFPQDDTLRTNFYFGEEISYAEPDENDGSPVFDAHYRPAAPAGDPDYEEFLTCLHFRDANASRIAMTGMNFSGFMRDNETTGDPQSIAGQYVEVKVFEWNDQFVDVDDAGFNFANLQQVAYGDFIYTNDDQQVLKHVPFQEALVLNDNQRYLACVHFYSTEIYVGYNTEVDYTENYGDYRQPLFPIGVVESGQTSFSTQGFGNDLAPAVSVTTVDAASASIPEEEANNDVLAPYPNPANTNITIPVQNFKGEDAMLTIYSIDGKVVKSQSVSYAQNINLNVEDLTNGRYIIKLTNNEEVQTFNVVIAR